MLPMLPLLPVRHLAEVADGLASGVTKSAFCGPVQSSSKRAFTRLPFTSPPSRRCSTWGAMSRATAT